MRRHKEVGTTLEPSEGVVRALLAFASDALFVVDGDGRIEFANDQAAGLFGWPSPDLVGLPLDRLVRPQCPGDHRAHRPRCFSRSQPARRRDGSEFPAEVRFQDLHDGRGTPLLIAAVHDTTDRVRLQQERERHAHQMAQERTRHLDRLGQLAGGMAHDVNNLLGVILNYTALLASQARDPQAVADLGEIRAAGEQAVALARQVLSFTRRGMAEPAPLDVNDLVHELRDTLVHQLGDVELHLDLTPDPAVAMIDRRQFAQVVEHLARNAGDAMAGQGRLTVRTAVRARSHTSPAPSHENGEHSSYDEPGSGPEEHRVVVQVVDQGIGMTPGVAARALEPFFTTKPRAQRTGLGLAAVEGIVHQHGGHVAIESAVGQGTTVTVELPVAGTWLAAHGSGGSGAGEGGPYGTS